MGQSRQTVGKSQNWCLFLGKSMSYALYTYQPGIYARFGSYQTVKPLYTCMANLLFLFGLVATKAQKSSDYTV